MALHDETVVEGSQFDHFLIVKDSEGTQKILLSGRNYKLGRSPENDIVLRSRLASRHHATLTGVIISPPLFQVFRLSDGDLEEKVKSTNGTQVNQVNRDVWVLMHGDEIVFSSDCKAYYKVEPEPPYANDQIDIFLDSLHELCQTYRKAGNYSDAEITLQQILALTQHSYGEVHPKMVNSLVELAEIYYLQNRFGNAEPLFLQAIGICQQTLGEDHLRVSAIMLKLATVYSGCAMYEKAETVFQQAIAVQEKALGAEHPEVAASLIDLASVYYAQNRFLEVKNLYERVLKIYKRSLDPNNQNIIQLESRLADLNEKFGSNWISWNNLFGASFLLLTGIVVYMVFFREPEPICVKALPDGTTQQVSSEVCLKKSK